MRKKRLENQTNTRKTTKYIDNKRIGNKNLWKQKINPIEVVQRKQIFSIKFYKLKPYLILNNYIYL